MSRRLDLEEWTARPDEPVRLRDKFSAGAVLLPTVYGLDSVGLNGFEFIRQNSSTLGRLTRDGLRLVADHAGSNDDRLATSQVIDSPRAADFTTVMRFRPLNGGSDRMDISMSGHQIQFQNASTLNVGYQGLNGAYFIHQFPGFSSAERLDKKFVFVVSTNLAERRLVVSVYVNGEKLTKTADWGTATSIGSGGSTLPLQFAPTLSSREFANYYHPAGYVELWGNFSGVFIEQDEADAIAANPWQIFEPKRIWVPVSGSVLIPTLSLAQVVALTATQGTPRVTLTF